MGHYKSNVRDLEFNLFEVHGLEKVLASGDFGDLDGETVRSMLAEAARQAEGPLAESFADADRRIRIPLQPNWFQEPDRSWPTRSTPCCCRS
jgi:hypothetical protein